MDFSRLVFKYPAGRALSMREQKHRLHQKRRLAVHPRYQLCVVKMNSTFLESTDKWYAWKGVVSAMTLMLLIIFSIGLGSLAVKYFLYFLGLMKSDETKGELLSSVLIIDGMVSIADAFLIWFLRKESFSYTHYPMRFNRKTRTVHVFRTDGSVLSAPWDKLFFTLGHLAQWDEWEVRGHLMENDGVTVKESFALSYVGSLNSEDSALNCTEPSSEDFVRAHWEFIRRYMEEEPQAVFEQVDFCMPIASKRESFSAGIKRVFANIAVAPLVLYVLMTPFCLVVSVFRVFAMQTSKIPRWPAGVEASCAIDPGDPYAFEGAADGTRVALFPDAARAAGIAFDPAAVHPPAELEPARSTGRPRRSPHKKRT